MAVTFINNVQQQSFNVSGQLVVSPTGVVVSNNDAFTLTGTLNARIDGAVYGNFDGFFDPSTFPSDNIISIGERGVVWGGDNGMDLSGFNDHIFNEGSISGRASAITFEIDTNRTQGLAPVIVNSGHIEGVFNGVISDDQLKLSNSGDISGDVAIQVLNSVIPAWGEGSVITNSGQITGTTAALQGQSIRVHNFGEISASGIAIKIDGAQGSVIENGGKIAGPIAIQFGAVAGDDRVDNAGLISGDVLLGGGTDHYDGRGGTITGDVHGGDGNDVLIGGATDDRLYGDGGNDSLTSGGNGDDLMSGGDGDDTVSGGRGDDTVSGDKGNDTLMGGDGDDTLIGGVGGDLMRGGRGNDVFLFSSVNDTAIGGSDLILDFTHGQDVIDLSAIDANPAIAKDQSFTFIGIAGFTHTAGQLRYDVAGSTLQVQGDTDGDGVADFMLIVRGAAHLDATDFKL